MLRRNAPLRRVTPLVRGTGVLTRSEIERRTPMPKVNRKRAAFRRERDFGAQAKLCRAMACACCTALGRRQQSRTVPAHLRSRGAGGRDDECVPLCALGCHPLLDDKAGSPEAFEALTGVDLVAVRDRLRRVVAGLETDLPAPWCFLPY